MRTMFRRSLMSAAVLGVAGSLGACAQSPRAAVDGTRPEAAPRPAGDIAGMAASVRTPATALNTLTPEEQRQGWTLLFDGKTLNGWQEYGGAPISEGWTVEDGTLVLRGRRARDIVTARPYGRYELALEWRLEPTGPAGNSGIFYNVVDTASAIYWAAPEMAVLDNARHPDGKTELTSSGAVHSMYPVPHAATRPTGEWNSVRLVVNGDHIEHWLNGAKVVEYELGSADWKARLAKSKFADKPLYGSTRSGRIGLQQHGSYVGYRNIKLRELK